MQVVAAVRGVSSGTFEAWIDEFGCKQCDDPMLSELLESLGEGRKKVVEAVEFVKTRGASYLDLSGRRLVDGAIAVIIGHLLLGQAAANDRKKRVARRFITRQMPLLRTNCEEILTGDTSALDEYAELAGPVPAIG